MPAFVICALGSKPRKVVVDSAPVRVGRDESNEIVLPNATVSREHAIFMSDEGGAWYVSCVSDTNPIVVDGKQTATGARVTEGSEVVVGTDAMIIFSQSSLAANSYLGNDAQKFYDKSACATCGWSGMVTAIRKNSACPRCGGVIRPADAHRPDNEQRTSRTSMFPSKATSHVDPSELQEVFAKLKASQQSRLERVDGKDDARASLTLATDKRATLAKSDAASLKLFGLFVFGSVGIAWRKDAFVITSAMSFPAMKINGAKVTSATLAHGDVIEVGGNRFRFSVGQAS
jgi:hypothetical protein